MLSTSRKSVDRRLVLWGLILQFLFTLLVLGVPALQIPGVLGFVFHWANDGVNAILDYTQRGTDFLFGPLNNEKQMGGFIFAVRILPTIIFFSSIMSVAYHLGVMQKIVRVFSLAMQKTMRTSGAETLSTAANIFVGQTEAPLMIRPYVAKMTQSELLTVMVGGMASTAGGVLAAYVGMLNGMIPDIAGHLISASVLSAPATLVISKIMLPELEIPQTRGVTNLREELVEDANVIDAAARGASEGLSLALNVAAMLLAFISLVALFNGLLGWLGTLIHFSAWGEFFIPEILRGQKEVQLSLELLLGWAFAPLAWVLGIPWREAPLVGMLLGEKTVINEFVAYLHLAQNGSQLSPRAIVITSYALCGFANFSSIAIQIGGIGGMAPERRSDLARLGLKAMVAGTLATFMTACFAGMVI